MTTGNEKNAAGGWSVLVAGPVGLAEPEAVGVSHFAVALDRARAQRLLALLDQFQMAASAVLPETLREMKLASDWPVFAGRGDLDPEGELELDDLQADAYVVLPEGFALPASDPVIDVRVVVVAGGVFFEAFDAGAVSRITTPVVETAFLRLVADGAALPEKYLARREGEPGV